MSSSLTPRKWVAFVLINVIVSAITALILIRVLNSEPSAARTAPLAQAPVAAPQQSVAAPAAVLEPTAAAPLDGSSSVSRTPTGVPDKPADSAAPTTRPTAATQSTVVSVRISGVQFPGQRTRESVAILNEGDQVDLTGWSIETAGNKVYTFKGFVLFRDSFITLYTTNGSDSPTSLFWNQNDAVWKKGDTVTLKQGAKVMATYTVK